MPRLTLAELDDDDDALLQVLDFVERQLVRFQDREPQCSPHETVSRRRIGDKLKALIPHVTRVSETYATPLSQENPGSSGEKDAGGGEDVQIAAPKAKTAPSKVRVFPPVSAHRCD